MPSLTVRVIGARTLNAADADGKSDPYAVLTLGSQKFKTASIKSTLAPTWNETFQVQVANPAADVLTVQVFDKDMIGSDDSLGSVTIPLAQLPRGVEQEGWFHLVGGDVGENVSTIGLSTGKSMLGGGGLGALSAGFKTAATGRSADITVSNKGEIHLALTANDFGGAGAAVPASSSSSSSSSSTASFEAAAAVAGVSTRAPTSSCTGTRRALLIGINYIGHEVGRLNGCINDTINVENYLKTEWGYPAANIRRLNDDNPAAMPNKANMIAGIQWLVGGAQPGDCLVFHYSGHGSQTAGGMMAKILEDDGKDETICPCDYQTAGQITDNELFKLLVKPLPAGVRLTCIFDSCHSGTALDLPFIYQAPAGDPHAAAHAGGGGISALLGRQDFSKITHSITGGAAGVAKAVGTMVASEVVFQGAAFVRPKLNAKLNQSKADVIMFSGCRDEQTSADATLDGKATGAMSFALLGALRGNKSVNYTTLIRNMRDALLGKFTQVPQMSFGRQLDPDMQVAF